MSTYLAYVTKVIDGDTFIISNRRIRLAGINAPESDTPQGKSATAYLRQLIEDQQVTINTVAIDTYGRSIANVWRYVDRLYINQEMIDSGHAEPA